jgi:hypothetical protein
MIQQHIRNNRQHATRKIQCLVPAQCLDQTGTCNPGQASKDRIAQLKDAETKDEAAALKPHPENTELDARNGRRRKV